MLTEREFLEIEEELAATERGRAFLRWRDRHARVVAIEEVRRLARSLRAAVRRSSIEQRDDGLRLKVLRSELQEMSNCIQQTRREIAALQPDEGGSSWITTATGELEAIVSATERATDEILNAAERIQELVGESDSAPELRRAIEAQVTEILTACSFQDITGQRTTKVVTAIRFIEQRVTAMLDILGADVMPAPVQVAADRRPDAHLLNGPPLKGGVTQDEVDALLGGSGASAARGGADGQALADSMFD
jgi:chemotaxis regulatin CheY-phosphate phosphatase CheZ